MEDNSNNNENPDSKVVTKLATIRAVKALSKPYAKFTLVQELLQEIIATHTIEDPTKKIGVPQLKEELRAEIEVRYTEDEELKNLLLDSIPTDKIIRYRWFKKDGWEEAVWAHVRGTGLFNKERRATLVNALYERALNRSDIAAKIWLTLSGDYSEKMQDLNKDKTIEAFREINEILHKKKNS